MEINKTVYQPIPLEIKNCKLYFMWFDFAVR